MFWMAHLRMLKQESWEHVPVADVQGEIEFIRTGTNQLYAKNNILSIANFLQLCGSFVPSHRIWAIFRVISIRDHLTPR